MGIFAGQNFNQFSGGIISTAVGKIVNASDPEKVAEEIRQTHRLQEIQAHVDRLHARNNGSDIEVRVPINGPEVLFTLQVSTNSNPVPNSQLLHLDDNDWIIVLTYQARQGPRTILSAIDSMKAVVKQHVDYVNNGVIKHNRVLDEEIDKTLHQRRVAVNEAAKIAQMINEEHFIPSNH